MKRQSLFFCLVLAVTSTCPAASIANSEDVNVYSYRMRGKVRLLFFWVGKDNVGGGTITISRSGENAESGWTEEVEALFGSNPDRVPGKINRWGYGREASGWSKNPETATGSDLRSTIFEGFMKHSKEGSLAEVKKNNDQQVASREFLYDGIRSKADASGVAAEIRTFATATDFRYQDSAPVHCGYQERLKQGGPDRVRALDPVPSTVKHPYGFLTGVQTLLRTVLKNSANLPQLKKTKGSLHYVYNGQEYSLELKDTSLIKKFELPLGGGQLKDGKDHILFQNIAKTEFRVTQLAKNSTHDFTLWFPLQGKLRGIPLRILDKPRWWLRIELNLEPDTQASPPRSNVKCLATQ